MSISNPTPDRADLDPSNTVDAIADVLMGGLDAPTQEPPKDEDPDAVETPPEDAAPPETEASDTEEPDDSQAVDDDEASDDETLATMLGLTDDQLVADDDGNLTVKVKINGKESTVDLQGLVKGYQFDQANNARAQELAGQRKAFEEAQQAEQARIQQQSEQAQGLALMFQQKLMAEYQNVNWEELRRLDPGEFAARQAEFQQRQQELQQAGQYMAQYRQQQEQTMGEQKQQARRERIEEQAEIMLQNNPTWSNAEVFESEMGALRGFVQTTYGFSEDDTRLVDDARLIELIKDAAAFRSGKSVAQKRNVPAPPKMQRATDGRFVKKQSKKQQRMNRLADAARKAKGADKRTLQTEAIAELLTGGT